MAIFKPPPISTAERLPLVLESGELVFDTDLQEFFCGDGATQGGNKVAGVQPFDFNQVAALTQWNITHNMGFKPSVTVIDTAGDQVLGDVTHNTDNDLSINFSSAIAGTAHLI